MKSKSLFVTGRAILAAICALAGAGCATSPRPVASLDPASDKTPTTLQAGDVINISFPNSPSLNDSQKIREDGNVNLAMIGEVSAAGKTPGSLQHELEERYMKDVANGQVVVTITSTGRAIYISGAVNKPTTIMYDHPITALEAIMQSGAFTPYADTKRVHLIRQSATRQQTQFLDMRAAMRGETTPVVYLRPGDMIYVPEKDFSF